MLNTTPAQQQYGITVLRVVVGLVFLAHGLQKLLLFGIGGTAGFLGSIGVPAAGLMAVVLIAIEVLGGLALILGLYTRYAAIPLAVISLVALLTVHLANGFFMGEQSGYEFVLTLLAANVALFFLGSGALALDSLLGTTRRTAAVAERA